MVILGLVICILLGLSSQVMAEAGGIRVGKTKLLPSLTVQALYDDNIYLGNGTNATTELEESDLITHLLPALGLNYTLPERGALTVGYDGDFAYYRDNDENDWQTHKGILNFNYQAPGGLVFDVDNIYTDAEDPFGGLEQYRIGLKTERWNNDLKTKAGYGFKNRFQILAYYNRYKQDYELERDYTQDYDENEFGVGFQMRLLPKTGGFVQYHVGERDYITHPVGTGVTESNDSDFNWHRINAGLTWDPGAKLSGELNLGYQWEDYENLTDVSGNRYDDKGTWIAATFVTYKVNPTTAFALSITRALREAGADTNEYFEDTGIGINLQQVILTKYTLTAGVAYSINDYNLPLSQPREDDNYNAKIGLGYRIRDWLSASIGYNYKKKDSNYSENDYSDNQFMISLRGIYRKRAN